MILAGEDSGKAGPLGLLVVVLLGIACYFLFKSMSGHLRRVQNGFGGDGTNRAAPPISTASSAPVDDGHQPARGTDLGGSDPTTRSNPSS